MIHAESAFVCKKNTNKKTVVFRKQRENSSVRKGCGVRGAHSPLTAYHGTCFSDCVPCLTLFIIHYYDYYEYFQENPCRFCKPAYMYNSSTECMGSPPLSTPHPFVLTSCTRDIWTETPFFNIHSQHNGSLSHIDCGWIKSTWCRASLIRRLFQESPGLTNGPF